MNTIDLRRYRKSNEIESKKLSGGLSTQKPPPRDSFVIRRRFSSGKKLQFYSDLSTLVGAGIDLSAALLLVEGNYQGKTDRKLIATLNAKVIEGNGFSSVLEESREFTPYEYNAIRIGEETGRLTEIFSELSRFYDDKIRLRKRLVSSLSYPSIVMFVAIVVVYFMTSYIVPMFEDVFHRFGNELPKLTLTVISISHFLKDFAPILVGLMVITLIGLRAIKNKIWFRLYSSRLVLRIPIIGKMVKTIYLSRLCLCMHLLLQAKTPLIDSLTLLRGMVQFYPVQSSLDHIIELVTRGNSLHASLAKFSLYDQRMITMIKIAEETNRLDLAFGNLRDRYSAEIDQKTAILGTILEPALIIFIGIIIGIILVSMYLPIFQLSTSFGL